MMTSTTPEHEHFAVIFVLVPGCCLFWPHPSERRGSSILSLEARKVLLSRDVSIDLYNGQRMVDCVEIRSRLTGR